LITILVLLSVRISLHGYAVAAYQLLLLDLLQKLL